MNISHDGMIVRFKTAPKELFDLEKSGIKPNTVRILDANETQRIIDRPPMKIIIQYQQELFHRILSSITHVGELCGKYLVIFSWLQKNVPLETDDGFVQVTVTEPMLHQLQNIAHGRTINMVIHELYQIYLDKYPEERGPLHD